jgi:hypothetical protein
MSRVDLAGRHLSRLRNPKQFRGQARTLSYTSFSARAGRTWIPRVDLYKTYVVVFTFIMFIYYLTVFSLSPRKWRADLLDATGIAKTRSELTLADAFAQ